MSAGSCWVLSGFTGTSQMVEATAELCGSSLLAAWAQGSAFENQQETALPLQQSCRQAKAGDGGRGNRTSQSTAIGGPPAPSKCHRIAIVTKCHSAREGSQQSTSTGLPCAAVLLHTTALAGHWQTSPVCPLLPGSTTCFPPTACSCSSEELFAG